MPSVLDSLVSDHDQGEDGLQLLAMSLIVGFVAASQRLGRTGVCSMIRSCRNCS